MQQTVQAIIDDLSGVIYGKQQHCLAKGIY